MGHLRRRPAVLGIAADGKLQVLAERSGRMKFEWSLAGQQDPAGGAGFVVALPPSPLSRLRIDLPPELAPAVDHGVVTEDGPTMLRTVPDRGFRRWRIELGGWPGCRLRLAKAGGEEARPQAIVASQSSTYDFSPRGLELTVALNVEGRREPLRALELVLDPGLELVHASLDDVPLAWNMAASQGEKALRATIEVPPPLQEGAAKLRLRAIAPLSMGGDWKLPRIVVTGAACRLSTARLSVAAPLCIQRLQTHGCRQVGMAPATTTTMSAWCPTWGPSVSAETAAPSRSTAADKSAVASGNPKVAAGEQLDFETFAADAAIEVRLGQRPTEVQAVSATATVLGQGKMSSRVAVDFRTAEGPVFSLSADVSPNWTIDSIESQPTDALDDWSTDRGAPGAPAGGSRVGGTQKLSVRLVRPLAAARPLRLIASARRLYAFPGKNLGIDDLVPLHFTGLAESKRWIDLRASGANELRLTAGDRSHRGDIKELTAAELDLFAEPPGDWLFREDGGASSLRLSLESRRPAYSSAIRVEAVAGDGFLAENYSFVCTPSKSAPVDRIVVHFTGHRDIPLTWTVEGLEEKRFAARRWSAQQEALAGLTADEEAWDVTFRRPRSVETTIRASRKTRLGGPVAVSLASLPDAARQDAMLIVRSLGPQVVRIKTRRLQSLPTEAASTEQLQTARATYRYEPRTEAMPQTEPAIVLTSMSNPSPTAWVWDCTVHSRFATDGAADHVVSYNIQNAGRRQIHLALPAPLARSDVHGIWVNDRPAAAFSQPSPPAPLPEGEGSKISPPLPLGEGRGEGSAGGVQLTIRSASRPEVH